MRYRLNPEAKRALLEQAMRIRTQTDDYSNVFAKLLCVNHMFISVGKFYKVTQLVITMHPYWGVKFYFGKYWNRTEDLNWTAEQARQFIKLFRVPSLKIDCFYAECEHEFDQYWPLIDCVEGKVSLEFRDVLNGSYDVSIGVVTTYWHKITSLKAPAKLINSQSSQPRKHFDKLSVSWIETFDELKQVLRHDVDHLELYYFGNLSVEEVEKFRETADKVKIKTFKFKHDVKFNRADSLVPLVQSVLGVSLNCQKIEILADFYFGLQSRFASTTDELIDKITQAYDKFIETKNLLGAFQVKIKMSFSALCTTSISYENKDIEGGWLHALKQRKRAFIQSECETIQQNNCDVITLETEDGLLNSKFEFTVCYRVNR